MDRAPPLAEYFVPGSPALGGPVSPGARDGGLPISLILSLVPSPRSAGRPRPLASSQGLCFLQALGGMGEEGTLWAKVPRLLETGHLPSTHLQTRASGHSSATVELGVSLSFLLIRHMGTPSPRRKIGLE